MRPLRLMFLLGCFIVLPIFLTCISLATAHPRNANTFTTGTSRPSRFRALFNFQTPSTLFPPSAMIGLTDDNTTFFIAKPADFGPSLPAKGLNGQLWIGMGFGEDVMQEDGVLASAEGELGCSDVPGWDGGGKQYTPLTPASPDSRKPADSDKGDSTVQADANTQTDAGLTTALDQKADGTIVPTTDDGTDDHLHHPSPGSGTPNVPDTARPPETNPTDKNKMPAHADIQSLQEGAEIAGKIVLLSRGGCGFLEKVKWAQRRGAVAVVVGDNARHASLLTMYARGDTSNITIPSVFTSHTTAHLLSSLMPPEVLDDNNEPPQSAKSKSDPAKQLSKINEGAKEGNSRPKTVTPDLTHKADSQPPIAAGTDDEKGSWVQSILSAFGLTENGGSTEEDSRRPPSSGNIDWVLVEDFDDQDLTPISSGRQAASKEISSKNSKGSSGKTKHGHADDFVIGEQDWRDPDLLKPIHKNIESDKEKHNPDSAREKAHEEEGLKGGSITPGSGEYTPLSNEERGGKKQSKSRDSSNSNTANARKSWFTWAKPSPIKDESHDAVKDAKDFVPKLAPHTHRVPTVPSVKASGPDDGSEREGLWITLTPTSMSSSPFLDTLLVLVVSPLMTLTVVYALLLLRSRIRRRRWRAPKSVVDQLPIRTYHTMATSAVSSQLSSPDASSPTTPLLRPTASSRTRPRSRTASSLPNMQDERDEEGASSPPPEKPRPANAWRRRYNGRQVECVVCLEDYIDGQSRVMSLPCGHEFHAECITPWLTTRRRTCPICKGDVVRSLAQYGSVVLEDSEPQNTSDDVQDLVVETRNDSPSAAVPIPRGDGEEDQDIERAEGGPASSVNEQPTRRGWRNMLSMSALSGDTIWGGRQTPVDRTR